MAKGNPEQSSEGKQRLEILLSAEEIEHLADLAQQLGLTISELVSRIIPFLEAILQLARTFTFSKLCKFQVNSVFKVALCVVFTASRHFMIAPLNDSKSG